jgi:hypothetical protein
MAITTGALIADARFRHSSPSAITTSRSFAFTFAFVWSCSTVSVSTVNTDGTGSSELDGGLHESIARSIAIATTSTDDIAFVEFVVLRKYCDPDFRFHSAWHSHRRGFTDTLTVSVACGRRCRYGYGVCSDPGISDHTGRYSASDLSQTIIGVICTVTFTCTFARRTACSRAGCIVTDSHATYPVHAVAHFTEWSLRGVV